MTKGTAITEALERAEEAYREARDEANRLAVLRDFHSHWSDFLTKKINELLHEKYDEDHNLERIWFTATGLRINEVLMIKFDFNSNDIPDYDSDEFTRDVIQPAIDEMILNPYVDITPNKDRMALGAYAINVNPTKTENYAY